MSNPEFHDKVFIVTGASSGIGKATALLAAGRGAKVALVARREDALKALTTNLIPDEYILIAADVTDETDRQRIVNQTLSRFGGIDILLNAAGIIGTGSAETTSLDEWDAMMDVNLRSV